MTPPTLSVILPNYNHAHHLRDSLGAILGQSLQPHEIIVIDDASTDDSIKVLEDLAGRNPSIRLVHNSINEGVVAGMNRGLSLASGAYVYFAAADDLVRPGFFEKSLGLLAHHPQAGLCVSDPAALDHATGGITEYKLSLSRDGRYFTPEEIVTVMKQKRILINGNCSILKRGTLVEAGGFLPELKWHCDFFALYGIAFRHGFCYLPEALTLWRASPDTYMSRGLRDKPSQREVLARLLRKLIEPGYRDVAPRFQASGALCLLPYILPLVIRRKEFRHFLTWTLLKRAWIMDLFWILPHPAQRGLRRAKALLDPLRSSR